MQQNPEAVLVAERSVLAAALVDPIAADRAVEILVATDFAEIDHAKLFTAIAGLVLERRPVDLVSVRGLLGPEIRWAWLSELQNLVTSGAYVTHHANLVLDASMRRQVAFVSEECRADADRADLRSGSAEEVIATLVAKLDAIQNRMPTRGPIQLAKAETTLVDRIVGDEPIPTGLPTGFIDLDLGQGFLRDGEMIVLAARPSVGKSLFAANVAEHLTIALEETVPVLVFSMEMSASALYRRFLFARSGVPSRVALGGMASHAQKEAIQGAHRDLKRAPWYVHDQPAMTAQRVHAISRRFQNKYGRGLIVIDYLQLMTGPGNGRYEMVTNLSTSMKSLASDLKCPVLVLAQLNRQVDRHNRDDRGDAIPVLSDLRDSGAIEQDADVVVFLARDTMLKDPHPCHAVVAKNRPGMTGKAQLLFDTNGPRFKNISRVEEFR